MNRRHDQSLSSIAWLGLLVAIASPSWAQEPKASGDVLRISVRELFTDQCLSCHSSEAKKGGLDLSRRESAVSGGKSGPALVAGRPDDSLLVEKLETGDMPPKHPLSAEQIASIRAWIAAGANYGDPPLSPKRAGGDWWSFQPIRRPSVPLIHETSHVRTPIDAFILARLDKEGLKPAPEAERRDLLRRVSFDLIGLPPSPEEIDQFLADSSPLAYEKVVDRLLNSPHYGERWGRHWLDVVRFAESHGYETNQLRPNAWPYRDYVIRAFNQDTPFEKFVAEQLAGDALPEGDFLTRSATGFLVGGAHDVVGIQTIDGMKQQRVDDLDDMITATGTAFLGLTIHCARCHDHKFDPIAQKDYYGLQAMFAGVNHADREVPTEDDPRRREAADTVRSELAAIDRKLDESEPLAQPNQDAPLRPAVDPRRNVERFAPVKARFVRFTILSTNTGSEPCIDELEIWSSDISPRNVAEGGRPTASSTYAGNAFHKLEHINDSRIGNGRSWISATPGKGWIQIELKETATIDRVVWARDQEGNYRDRTPVEYRIEVEAEPGRWTEVASSSDRRLPDGDSRIVGGQVPKNREALSQKRAELRDRLTLLARTSTRAYAGTFSQPGPTHVLRRGDPMQELETVPPSGVRALNPPLILSEGLPEAERRLALARWIGDAKNPLPARVMVNRVWQYHFGQGLVRTPSDFGFQGDRPSHPELLDWLAAEFLENGGRMKPIHRLIVISSTYQQSKQSNPDAMAIDASNRWLWRMSPRRLEVEAIRDTILAVSGKLDRRMGGPGYDPWQPNTNYVVVFQPKPDLGPAEFRRMVYQFRPRSQTDPTFGVFDCPDGGLVAPRRNVSTTALQAASLMNSRFMLAQSHFFAERLKREAPDDRDAQIRLAFRLAFGREPTDMEQPAASTLVREHGLDSLCRALFNANEFLQVP